MSAILKRFSILAILLVLLAAVFFCVIGDGTWSIGDIALADEPFVFDFSYSDGEFVVTDSASTDSANAEVYRGRFSYSEIKSAIDTHTNGADYTFTIPKPTVDIELTSGHTVMPYSKTVNNFAFSAQYRHSMSGLDGFEPVDKEYDFGWNYWTDDEAAKTRFAGGAESASFGVGCSPDDYYVSALATVTFSFAGKTATSRGESSPIHVLITATQPSVSDRQVNVRYGESLADILNQLNSSYGDGKYSLEGDFDESIVHSVGTYKYPVTFTYGHFLDTEFIENPNYTSVQVNLTIRVEHRYTRILLDDKEMVQGAQVPEFTYSLYGTLASGDTLEDLGLEFTCAADGNRAGVFHISGKSSNTNYVVFISNAEQIDENTSAGATLTVYPTLIELSNAYFNFRIFRAEGFGLNDTAVLSDFYGVAHPNIAEYVEIVSPKVIRFYRDGEEIAYDNVTVEIELRGEEERGILFLSLVNGVWTQLSFDENGIIRISGIPKFVAFTGKHFITPSPPFEDNESMPYLPVIIWGILVLLGFGLFALLTKFNSNLPSEEE